MDSADMTTDALLPLNKESYRSLEYDFVKVQFLDQFSSHVSGFFLDEKFPQVQRNGLQTGFTEAFCNPRYQGRHTHSSRHLLQYPFIIKGAGGIPTTEIFLHSRDGNLNEIEALTEYSVARYFQNQKSVPEYCLLGRYNSQRYFVVRSAKIPRLVQFDQQKIDPQKRESLAGLLQTESKLRDPKKILQQAAVNLFWPFTRNAVHDSINFHNVNLLGQYLDLGMFQFGRDSFWVDRFDWEHPYKGHLHELKSILSDLAKAYSSLFQVSLKFEDAVPDSLQLQCLGKRVSQLLTNTLKMEDDQLISWLRSQFLAKQIVEKGTRFFLPSDYQQNFGAFLHLIKSGQIRSENFISALQRIQTL
jgi:hypothetical protein